MPKMQKLRVALLVVIFCEMVFTANAQVSTCLTLIKDFPLPGTATRFDYQAIDEGRSLLFIAHLGDNSVAIFNMKSSTLVKTIGNIPKPHGILVVPKLKKVYVSGTGSNEIYVLDENSLDIIKKIPAGTYPDGLDYDPKTNRIFVSDEHGKTVTVFDALDNKVLSTIEMGGEVGNTHYDPVSGLIYSAVHNSNVLVEIDPVAMKIVSRYKLPGCQQPHGFFIEPDTHYAFVTGEGNASYVVFDLTKKLIIGSGKVGVDPDVLAFDNVAKLLFVSSESGVVSVFKVTKAAVTKICEGLLAPRAHTVAVDPSTHRVYFPLENVNGGPVLRVMESH